MLGKLQEILKAGGFTLGFIVVLSIAALAVAIERSAALWRFLDRARQLAETVKRCLYRGAVAEARTACERSTSPVADLFLVGFERFGRSKPAALEAAVERERQRVSLSLKGPLWVLGTIGATAPFIGLFGTVVGIMRAFEDIRAHNRAGLDVVGGGIAEALITTAFGIAVGIEAVMIYNYFQNRLSKTAVELKLIAEEFVELLHETEGGKEARPAEKEKAPEKDRAPEKDKPRADEPRAGKRERAERPAREGREARDGRDGKESREARDGRDGRESREGRDGRDGKESRDSRDGRDGKESRDSRDGKDARAASRPADDDDESSTGAPEVAG